MSPFLATHDFDRSRPCTSRLLTVAPAILVLMVSAGPLAQAQEPTSVGMGGATIRTWGVEQGLPSLVTFGVTLDGEGFLWIATAGGVARFDGASFDPLAAIAGGELPAKPLAITGFRDQIWILTEDKQVHRWTGREYLEPIQLPSSLNPVDMASDERAIWIRGAEGRLLKGIGDRFGEIDAPFQDLQYLLPDGEGGAWLGGLGIARLSADPARTFLNVSPGFLVERVAYAPEAGQLVAAGGTRLLLREPTGGQMQQVDLPGTLVGDLLHLRDGTVVFPLQIGSAVFLYQLDPRQATTPRSLVLLSETSLILRDMLEDAEGNIWAGTEQHGLVRIRRTPVVRVSPTVPVLRVAGEQEGVYALLGCDELRKYQRGGTWSRVDPDFSSLAGCIAGIAQDRTGRLWIGGNSGLLRIGPEGHQLILRTQYGTGLEFRAFHHGEDGTLWLGTNKGVRRVRPGTDSVDPEWGALNGETIFSLASMRDTLWVGSGKGLRKIVGGRVDSLRPQALPEGQVRALVALPDSSGAVAGWYGSGLAVVRGSQAALIDAEVGLVGNHVSGLIMVGDTLYVHTNGGIQKLGLGTLDAYVAGRAQFVVGPVLDPDDGLPEANGGGSSSIALGGDGAVWMTSVSGLIRLDPTIPWRRSRTTASVRSIAIEGRVVNRFDPVVLDRDEYDLSVVATGLSFGRPSRVRYVYNLEGLDDRWRATPAGEITFRGLAPGQYTLHLESYVNGVMRPGDRLGVPITKLGYFYQKRWFRWLGLALVILGTMLVSFVYARRQRRRTLEIERLNHALVQEISGHRDAREKVSAMARRLLVAQEEERRVVATELHDEFGGQLTFLQLLLGAHPESGRALEVVGDLFASIRRMVQQMRPQSLDLFGLVSAVREMAEGYTKHSGMEVLVACDCGEDDRFDRAVETAAYRFVQEGLTNAARHGRATRVSVSIEQTLTELRLTISDDGVGFEPAETSLGLGIAAMNERAESLGGALDVSSSPGQGTHLKLVLPLASPLAD